ncbi:MAG: hypothetical protein ACKV2T_38905 [Kofleriaceae bacterium]
MSTPTHLRAVASYLRIIPRSVDGTLSFAWTFGLVCFALLLAAGGLAVDILVFDAPRGQLGIAALGAVLGGTGALWCIRIRRRRLALRAAWRAAAETLATRVGGRVITVHEILPWLVAHWPHPLRVEDVAHSACAQAIATPSGLIHVEPEGTKEDSELPEAHLVVFAPGIRTARGFEVEHVGGASIARLDGATRARVLANPDAFAQVTTIVRELLA